jgi:hypothetical protein
MFLPVRHQISVVVRRFCERLLTREPSLHGAQPDLQPLGGARLVAALPVGPAGHRREQRATPDLAGPDDAERERRLSWSVLMKRTMGLEVLDCPRCHARMKLIAAIEDPAVARKILLHLNLPTRPPPRGRPRRLLRLGLVPAAVPFDGIDPPVPVD